jgi:hypothetical protein
MSTTAGYLKLVVDSTSVEKSERAIDSFSKTSGRVEGQVTIDMGQIEAAMERLGQKVVKLDSTMSGAMRQTTQTTRQQAQTFEQLRAAIDPAFAMSQRYRDVQQQLARMVESGETSQRSANIVLEQAASRYMGVHTAAERAAAAQQAAELAAEQSRAGYEALRASVDPLYASSRRYDQALETLDAAQKQGVISDRERAQTLKLLEARMIGTGQATKSAALPVGGFMSLFSKERSHDLRQIGMQLSQVGQQGSVTGDYLSAAAIQAADVGMYFGIAGIAIGTLISVMGPALVGLIDLGSASDKLGDDIERLQDLSQGLSNVFDILQMNAVELSNKYGEAADRVRRFAIAEAELRSGEIREHLRTQIADLEGVSVAYTTAATGGRTFRNTINRIEKQFGLTNAQAKAFNGLLQGLNKAPTFDRQQEALQKVFSYLEAAGVEASKMPAEMAAALISTIELSNESDAIKKLLKDIAIATGQSAGEASRLALEANAVADAFLQASANSMSLQRAMAGLSIPFSDAMADLDFELSTAGMSAADKLVATRVKRLEETMRSASENAFGFDYGLTAEQQSQLSEYEKALRTSAESLVDLGKAGAAASKSSIARLMAEIGHRETLLDLTGDERKQYEALRSVRQRLGKDVGKYSDAQIAGIADRLVALEEEEEQMRRLADFSQDMAGVITGALFDPDSAADAAKDMLRQIAYQFTQNQIVLPIVGQLTGVLGTGLLSGGAAQAGGVAQAGGGLLGGFVGSIGANAFGGGAFTAGSGLLGGFGATANAVFGAGGGIGGLFSIGANTAAAGGGLAATIGAAAPPLFAVAAAISFFSGKTKELDRGFRVTVDGLDSVIEQFRHLEKKRFWGLSKKRSFRYNAVDDETAGPLEAQVASIGAGVVDLADMLGLAADGIDNARYQFQVSTKGLSDEEVRAAFAEQFDLLADEFAGAVVGSFTETNIVDGAADVIRGQIADLERSFVNANDTDRWEAQNGVRLAKLRRDLVDVQSGVIGASSEFVEQIERFNPAFEALMQEGEGAFDTLSRLATSLSAFNQAADMLNISGVDASLSGGSQASEIVTASGGIEQFSASVSSYYAGFYSDQERHRELVQQTRRAMQDLGLELPKTRDGFRDLVEAQDLTTESGQKAWAALTGMSTAAAQLYSVREANQQQEQSLREQIWRLLGETGKLRQRELNGLDETNRKLQERIWRINDEAALYGRLRGDVTSAMGVVRGLINADISKVRSDTATTVSQLNSDLSTARNDISSARSAVSDFIDQISTDSVDKFRSMRDGIRSALADRGLVSALPDQAKYLRAAADISRYAGGTNFSEADLTRALSGLSGGGQQYFSSFVEYARDAANTNQALRNLEGLTQGRLSDADKEVRALRNLHGVSEEGFTSLESAVAALQNATAKEDQLTKQIKAVELASDMEIKRLDDLLTATQQTADTAIGIPPALQDIASALGGLETAISSLKSVGAASSAGGGAANTNSVPRWKARELAIAAGTGDRSALYAFEQRILNAGRAGLANDWERGEFDRLKLAGFSGGGFTGWGARTGGLDGEGGKLAMLHPRETVIDHHKGQHLFGAGIEREMRAFRQELASLRRERANDAATNAKWIQRTARSLDVIERVGIKTQGAAS